MTGPDQEQQEADEDDEDDANDEDEVPLPVEEDEDVTDESEEVIIEDEETPLALNEQTTPTAKGKNLWWWSIIPVIAAGVAGKAGYDKKHKKGIFADKQGKEDQNKPKK